MPVTKVGDWGSRCDHLKIPGKIVRSVSVAPLKRDERSLEEVSGGSSSSRF